MDIKMLRNIEKHFGKKAIRVENKEKFYKIDFNDNSTVSVFKSEEFSQTMAEIHKDQLEIMSKCSTKTLNKIKELCELNINDEPYVSSYFDRSYSMAHRLEKAYKEIGVTNSLHFFIKNINPHIYGEAQTFMSRVTELHSLIEEVLALKKSKRGKLRIVKGDE